MLSVSKIVKKGNAVLFDKTGCTIRNANKEILLKCKPTGGVYRVETNEMCMLAKKSKTAKQWHRGLGHVNFQILQRMKNNPSYGISYEDDDHEIRNCEVCAKGKHTRTPFAHKSETSTKQVLELMHSDLGGPMENTSYGGAKYMLAFVDDFSRMVFLYFLKKKSEVWKTFIEFKQLVENPIAAKIKMIRTDNLRTFANPRG